MATGWAKDGAVQDQIDASVEDAFKVGSRHIRESFQPDIKAPS